MSSFRIATKDNKATTWAFRGHWLLSFGASFHFWTRSFFAGGFAALAFIIVDSNCVTIGTGDLWYFWTRLLSTRPFTTASIRSFNEFVTGFIARRWLLLGARHLDLGCAFTSVLSRHNSKLVFFAYMDWVIVTWFVLIQRASAFVYLRFPIDHIFNLTGLFWLAILR